MKILGIDPGYERVGIAIIEKEKNGKESLVFSACFKTLASLPFEERLAAIGEELKKIIKKYTPDILAIEKLFFAKNQKTALMVSEARGVIVYTGKSEGLEVQEFTPNEIKVAVTGYGKATKKDIAFMLPKLINVEIKGKIDDELDAIAVALTCSAHNKMSYPHS